MNTGMLTAYVVIAVVSSHLIFTRLSLNSTTDFFSGGSIQLDGMNFLIPRNTYVTLPNINVMWSELFNEDGTPNIPNFMAPGVTYETTVLGNQVNGEIIVALVFITQSSVRLINGFVNDMDLETGFFWVGGNSAVPNSGIKCRLNDPVGKSPSFSRAIKTQAKKSTGRYGIPYTDWPQWSVDDENPSVTAQTGYPMCIPRYANGTDDPLCPLKNRIQNDEILYAMYRLEQSHFNNE
jgi:hypothetical protein